MEGDFVIKDSTSPKGKKNRKCRVNLQTNTSEEAILQISGGKSNSTHEVDKKVVLSPENWVVCFAETKNQAASLALVKPSALTETIVLEAMSYKNVNVLKMMETKLHEFLRVISYDVTIQAPTGDESKGIIHIFRDKIIVTQGFPPNLQDVVSHSLKPGSRSWMRFVDKTKLCFGTRPDVFVISEHSCDIWKTLQGCVRALGFFVMTQNISEQAIVKPIISMVQNGVSGQLHETVCEMKPVEHPYYNLHPRPCRYIYMNLSDARRAPFRDHRYVNVFNVAGTIYQNWQNCQGSDSKNSEEPPPCPPRRPPPLLPPRPGKRPPNSPLPPVPPSQDGLNAPTLPPRRFEEKIGEKEMQYVVFSSKPLVGQFWVIQVIFLEKNDYCTLEKIKKLEEESNYQMLKPLPEYIKVAGDFKILLLDIESGWKLKSDKEHVVEFQVVKEAVLQSCWMVIEFHIEHNEQIKRNFHARMVMEPKTSRNTLMAKKDVLISANFQDEIQNSMYPFTTVCTPLKNIEVSKYLEMCSLLDIASALNNDWTGLAGEVGLNINEVFRIQSKAFYPNYSPTSEVLNIWSQRDHSTCNIEKLRSILKRLQRFDVLEVLDITS